MALKHLLPHTCRLQHRSPHTLVRSAFSRCRLCWCALGAAVSFDDLLSKTIERMSEFHVVTFNGKTEVVKVTTACLHWACVQACAVCV